MNMPEHHSGLRHIALFVKNLDECVDFYINLLGFEISWQDGEDKIQLTSGSDNISLYHAKSDFNPGQPQRLNHLGIVLKSRDQVDEWYNFLCAKGCFIQSPPTDYNDHTRGFFLNDPAGNMVQMIYFPGMVLK